VSVCVSRSELLLVADNALTVSVYHQRETGRRWWSGGSAMSASEDESGLLSLVWSFVVPRGGVLPSVHRISHLGSGYVDPYNAETGRHQVLVVVTAALEVFCLDTNTRQLLWSQSLPDGKTAQEEEEEEEGDGERDGSGDSRSQAARGGMERSSVESEGDAVSLLINPHPMRVNDSGVVVVGVRRSGSALGRHFSYFASSCRSGVLRWHHDATDFLSSSDAVDAAHILHDQHDVHTGEVEWRNYREAFLDALPHSHHQSAFDTRMTLTQLTPPQQRQGQVGSKQAEREKGESSARASARIASALPSSHLAVAASARLAHSDAEHIPHPNAIVAHTEDGIELMSFYTGRPLAHLALSRQELHADINGDGVIDHVQIVSQQQPLTASASSPSPSLPWLSSPLSSPCTALVSSAIPPSSHLFNVSLCTSGLDRLLSSLHWERGGGRKRDERIVSSIPISQSLLGRRHIRIPSHKRNTALPADDGSDAAFVQEAGGEEREGDGQRGGGGEAQVRQQREINADEDSDPRRTQDVEWVAAPLAMRPPVIAASESSPSSPLLLYFLSSSGLLTAVDGRGRKQFARRTVAQFESSAGRPHLTQRLQPYDMRSDSAADCLLLSGVSRVVVVNRYDGSDVMQAHLFSPDATLLAPPVTGDLNGDGYADIVLTVSDGFDVVVVAVHRGSQLFPRLLLVLTASIALLVAAHVACAHSELSRRQLQSLQSRFDSRQIVAPSETHMQT
jgi:hypothetical protein